MNGFYITGYTLNMNSDNLMTISLDAIIGNDVEIPDARSLHERITLLPSGITKEDLDVLHKEKYPEYYL